MSAREIRLSELLNRRVRDVTGRAVGRIEELRAEPGEGDARGEHVVTEYHLGSYAFFEALAGGRFGGKLASMLGGRLARRYVVPWDVMDLTDPAHPRLLIRKSELPEG